MDKMGVVNNTKERDAQVAKRHDALLKKKGVVYLFLSFSFVLLVCVCVFFVV